MEAMRRIMAGGVIAALLLAAVPVQAGPIRAQALAATRKAALLQAGEQTHRRSQVRTWSGIGIVGAGLILAFSGKECGTTGSLGPGWMQTVLFASVSISADGLEPVMAAGGECAIEFTVTSRVSIAGQDFSVAERVRVSRRSELDLSFFPEGDDVPPEVGETVVKSVIGSAVASESRSRGRMVAGIGMAGAGILLATVFANVPVAVTRLDRSGVTIGTGFGW